MAILQIHAQGPWQRSFVTRYHLKIIIICSGFRSCAFRQSEISFTEQERDLIFVCERRWRCISRRLQNTPKSSGPLKSNGQTLSSFCICQSVKLSPPGDGWEPEKKKKR